MGLVDKKLQTIQPLQIYERLSVSKAKQLLLPRWDRRGSTRGNTETLAYWKNRILKLSEKAGQTEEMTAQKSQASWGYML